MFDFNDNIIFQEKKFPHIFFSITVSITLILFYQLLSYYLFLSFGNAIGKNSEAYIVGAGQIFFMILPLLLIMKLSPLSPKTLFRLESKPGINFYIIAILGFVSLYVLIIGLTSLQNYILPDWLLKLLEKLQEQIESEYSNILGGSSTFDVVRGLLIGALIPGICEELMFRGFLQRSLEESLPAYIAIIITGILFSIIHFNPSQIVQLALLGIYFGIAAYLSKSIIIPFILHFFNNALSIISLYSLLPEKAESDTEMLSFALAIALTLSGFIITSLLVWLMVWMKKWKKAG